MTLGIVLRRLQLSLPRESRILGSALDSAVAPGSAVPAEYDSLLANVVAHAPTRSGAASRLREMLRDVRIAGIRTDRELLIALLGVLALISALLR